MCSKIFFTLSVFFLSASLDHKNEVPDQVVLRTGKISITEYELEKNLQLFLADFTREKGYKPTDTAIANWINSFIDRTYFLADACDKGYDTTVEVNKWVASMAHYVISKPDGLLSEKMTAGITVSEQELQSALQMQPVFLQTDSVKNKIRKVLKQQKMQQAQDSFAAMVKAQSQIKINAPVSAELISYLKQAAISRFNNNEYNAGDQSVLFWYKRGDTLQPVSTTRFMNYYNTLPLRKEMVEEEALQYYAETYVYDLYAWDKADAYGITRSLQFRLDENNYRNNVMWARYENKEMNTGITVSEDEVRNRYEAGRDSFIRATDVVLSAYSFNNRQAAISAIINIRNGKAGEKDSGLQPVYAHKSINYKQELFPVNVFKQAFLIS